MDIRRRQTSGLPTTAATIFCMLLFGTAFTSPAGGDPGASDDTKKAVFFEEFAFAPGGTLMIDVDDMDIHIKAGSERGPAVEVYVRGRSGDDARDWLEKTHFEARLEGSTLVISNREPDHVNVVFTNWFRSVQARAVVYVPAQTDVSITTEDGDVRIGDLDGSARVHTEDGDLEFSTVRGASIEIETEDGDIEAGSLEARDVGVTTEDGDLQIDAVRADRVRVISSDGDISVSRIDGGRVSVETNDGDVDIAVSGERLEARCSDGDMMIELLTAMEVDIRSDDGDIDLRIPSGIGADIDLRGDHLAIRDIEVKGRVSDDAIEGSIGGGGPLIRAKVRDGSIRIHQD
ncbi:MAG: DUF4097 family beta strand repeat-containing protein, partial [bacterium]